VWNAWSSAAAVQTDHSVRSIVDSCYSSSSPPWETKELVLSAGTSAGIGEPSLTLAGDLSFVLVSKNDINGTTNNRYDADPWIALTTNAQKNAVPAKASNLELSATVALLFSFLVFVY
jgi:hypothetical protein